MANLKYFADLPNGDTKEFSKVWNRSQSIRHDDTWGWDGSAWIKITRVIERKGSPSLHKCDDRCMHATGRTMRCECSCGGKNHGRGLFRCEGKAA